MPDRLHGQARLLAKEEGLSMSEFLVASVSHEVIRQETLDFFREAAKNYDPQAFEEALAGVPDVPPADYDKLKKTSG